MINIEKIDEWEVNTTLHSTKYIAFKNNDKISCISKSVHKNGAVSYVLSDLGKETEYYGSESEKKLLWAMLNEQK